MMACGTALPSTSISAVAAGESSSVTAASRPSDCGLPFASTSRQRTTRASVDTPASVNTDGSMGGTRSAPLTCTWNATESSESSSSGRSKMARISPFAPWLVELSAGQLASSLGVAESLAETVKLATCVSVGIASSCPLRSWTWALGL